MTICLKLAIRLMHFFCFGQLFMSSNQSGYITILPTGPPDDSTVQVETISDDEIKPDTK
jgi:hypothetical protein